MRPIIYVCFTPELLSLRLVGTGHRVEDVPELAVEAVSERIFAIGRSAREVSRPHTEVRNPFPSGSTLVGDFTLAEVLLLYQLEILRRPVWWARIPFRKPDLLLHPLHAAPGSLGSQEVQGLVDLGRRVGGRRVEVYLGGPLTDDQILARRYDPERANA